MKLKFFTPVIFVSLLGCAVPTAYSMESVKATRLLFCAGIMEEIEVIDNTGDLKKALHKAILDDSLEDIVAVIDRCIQLMQTSDKSSFSLLTLLKSILYGKTEEIKVRMQELINQGKDGKAPLLWAILLSKANATKALLEAGAKVDSRFVDIAVSIGDVKTVLNIVKNGVNISPHMDAYMRLAITNTCADNPNKQLALELMQKLIKRGYPVNKAWKFGVWQSRYRAAFKLLLKNKLQINYVFIEEKTPLAHAIQDGDVPAVNFLLKLGADINQKSSKGTPLYYAVKAELPKETKAVIIKRLLDLGANLD